MSESEKLTIELTPEEVEGTLGSINITFEIWRGYLRISDSWGEMSSSYGDGESVNIPPRVWALALPWIIARMGAG